MAQVLSIKPLHSSTRPESNGTLFYNQTHKQDGKKRWATLQQELRCNGKFSCLFSGSGREVTKKVCSLMLYFIPFWENCYWVLFGCKWRKFWSDSEKDWSFEVLCFGNQNPCLDFGVIESCGFEWWMWNVIRCFKWVFELPSELLSA